MVSTSVGAEGVKSNEMDILIADSLEEFADALLMFEINREYSRKIAEARRQLVEMNSNWRRVCKQWERV